MAVHFVNADNVLAAEKGARGLTAAQARSVAASSDPPDVTVAPVDPKLGATARKFAVQIVNSAKQAAGVIEQRQQTIAQLQAEHDRLASDIVDRGRKG